MTGTTSTCAGPSITLGEPEPMLAVCIKKGGVGEGSMVIGIRESLSQCLLNATIKKGERNSMMIDIRESLSHCLIFATKMRKKGQYDD